MGSQKQQLQPSEHSRSSPLLLSSSTFLLVPPPYSPATSNYHNSHTLSTRHTNTIMPADAVRSLSATNDVERIEAPVTWKAYMMCAFASFGGTFFGAIIAGDVADIIGRKWTIIAGCIIYIVGVILQVANEGLGLIVAGRLVAGLGVGFESAIVILYMSDLPEEGPWCPGRRFPILHPHRSAAR